jgi:hypothetical protein
MHGSIYVPPRRVYSIAYRATLHPQPPTMYCETLKLELTLIRRDLCVSNSMRCNMSNMRWCTNIPAGMPMGNVSLEIFDVPRLDTWLCRVHDLTMAEFDRVMAKLLVAERRNAFVMLLHARVGESAILGRLPAEIIRRLFSESLKGRRGKPFCKMTMGGWMEEVD